MTVYFDNAATTMVCPEAAQAVYDAMTVHYGNPSSTHGAGRAAKALLDSAREAVAAGLGAKAEEIFFTSGGTEGDNWAVRSGAQLQRGVGRHIITSAVEHDAIRKPMAALESAGYEVTYLTPEASGSVSPSQVAEALRPDTALVSLMLVNNESGAVNDIAGVKAVLKRTGSSALLHTDAVQAFCKIPFTARSLGADLITLSSHKIHGPKGSGALWVRSGVRLQPLIAGGAQEKTLRGGTEALPAIAGFGKAAALAKEALPAFTEKAAALRARLEEHLAAEVPEAVILSGSGGAAHIVSLSLPGYRSEVLLNCLDADGVYVSKSSACKKGARSHVLEAMHLSPAVIDGAIRVSFSRFSTMDEVDYFVRSLAAAAARLRHR